MEIRAVIFDLGGVLVRTDHPEPRVALAQKLGMDRTALENMVFESESAGRASVGQIPVEEHWENLRLQLGLAAGSMDNFQEGFFGGDVLDWSLVDYLRALRPGRRTGLLSNAFSSLRHFITNVWKFDDAFDDMIISAEVGLLKPDARIYQLAVERLGVAPGEAIFIDDFERNISGARLAGLQAIHFRSAAQTLSELNALLDGGAS